ncbi:MAG: hypothetical protein FWB95_01980 [Treponema sp.]|nr:hypothetical protein [Treponema sp.]
MSDNDKDQKDAENEKKENQRPNQKYNLSRNSGEVPPEGLTFYYNRERRLANAPESVRDMYKEQKKTRFGLFSVLVADKPRTFLFAMIVLLCVAILVLSLTGYLDTSTFDGNRLDITGTHFEGATIILIKKSARNNNAYSGAVEIAVSVPQEDDFPVFYHRIFFSMEKEEMYRFAVPFDSAELLMVLQSEKNTLQLKLIPK